MRHALFALCFVLLSLAGCYETAFVVGREADANVDAALLGTWSFDAPGGDDKALLTVAADGEHRYAIEWKTPSDNKTIKMNGFVADVGGAMFLNATPFDADGKPAAKHWLIRFDRDGDDGLLISNLNPEFFKALKIDSDDALRAVIEKNLADPGMYVEESLPGKRVVAK